MREQTRLPAMSIRTHENIMLKTSLTTPYTPEETSETEFPCTPAVLEDLRNVVRNTVPAGPLCHRLHDHEEPEALAKVGVGLAFLERGPARRRGEVGLFPNLRVHEFRFLLDAGIGDGFAAESRQGGPTVFVPFFEDEITRCFGDKEGKAECDARRDKWDGLDETILSPSGRHVHLCTVIDEETLHGRWLSERKRTAKK